MCPQKKKIKMRKLWKITNHLKPNKIFWPTNRAKIIRPMGIKLPKIYFKLKRITWWPWSFLMPCCGLLIVHLLFLLLVRGMIGRGIISGGFWWTLLLLMLVLLPLWRMLLSGLIWLLLSRLIWLLIIWIWWTLLIVWRSLLMSITTSIISLIWRSTWIP